VIGKTMKFMGPREMVQLSTSSGVSSPFVAVDHWFPEAGTNKKVSYDLKNDRSWRPKELYGDVTQIGGSESHQHKTAQSTNIVRFNGKDFVPTTVTRMESVEVQDDTIGAHVVLDPPSSLISEGGILLGHDFFDWESHPAETMFYFSLKQAVSDSLYDKWVSCCSERGTGLRISLYDYVEIMEEDSRPFVERWYKNQLLGKPTNLYREEWKREAGAAMRVVLKERARDASQLRSYSPRNPLKDRFTYLQPYMTHINSLPLTEGYAVADDLFKTLRDWSENFSFNA